MSAVDNFCQGVMVFTILCDTAGSALSKMDVKSVTSFYNWRTTISKNLVLDGGSKKCINSVRFIVYA